MYREVALKAVSLALASIAYLLYLLSMAFHYSPRKGFVIPVLGWLASATILFSLVGVEVRQHQIARTEQSVEYTQYFFAGILAASIYCLIAILLATYVAGARSLRLSFTDRQTVECTSIIYRAIALSVLLLGGAGIYSTVEGWSLMDALYFTDYTILTIGIGNITPQTHLGRSLLFPYATAGIVSLGLVITGVASFTNQMRDLKLSYQIDEARRIIRGQGDAERTAKEIPTDGGKSRSASPVQSKFPQRSEVLKLHKVKSDFYRRNRWEGLIFFSAAWFMLWLVSAAAFRRSERNEDWTYFTALYFTYTSLTTIGYGDFYPTSNFGTVFFIFWSLLALPILTNLVTAMGEVLRGLLLLCYGYLWKRLLHGGHRQHHHSHEGDSRLFEEHGNNVLNNTALHPVEPDHESRMRDHCRDLFSVEFTSQDVQATSRERRRSTQYRLLLAEEVERLLPVLRDETPENWEEVCCMWSRVIPLLHVGEKDASSSYELASFSVSAESEHMTLMKLTDPKKAFSERNTEISWILMLLVEKLCSDLRKELSEADETVP